ncbi:MAG TPA: ribosome-associated translation inhibitor RaiA [bacterium]|nr:ribosome-associated translation inhibitor RaiA [bacterium]
MQLIITSRRIDLADDVRAYVHEKMEKINNYYDRAITLRVELSREEKRDDGKPFGCDALLSIPNKQIRVEKRGGELFEAIDLAEEALESQLKSHKEKLSEENVVDKGELIDAMSASVSDDLEEELYDFEYHGPGESMTLDEAKEQMQLLKQDFYVFINKDTGKTNTVYKKSDGRYGVIVED